MHVLPYVFDDSQEIKVKNDLQPRSIILTKKEVGKVISMVQLVIIPDILGGRPSGYIHHVNTAQTHRGKGVALQLVKDAIRRAKDEGCYKLFLTCDRSLIPFYQKAGMREYQLGMDIRF